MSNHNSRFVFSNSKIKVYLKPQYNPILKAIDLQHPDISRKAKELFDRRSGLVKGLPKICSEHSEDARTWKHFSPLLSMSAKDKQLRLRGFLEDALDRKLSPQITNTLTRVELMFWRGRKASPFYVPPPNLGFPEGKTEVDLTIKTPQVLVFVEAKYLSEIAKGTTYCPQRDQIVRNIDVGTYYAWKRNLDFFFIILASQQCRESIELLQRYRSNPQSIVRMLPHRPDVEDRLGEVAENLGLMTWDRLEELENI
jgi:hypothetical protein